MGVLWDATSWPQRSFTLCSTQEARGGAGPYGVCVGSSKFKSGRNVSRFQLEVSILLVSMGSLEFGGLQNLLGHHEVESGIRDGEHVRRELAQGNAAVLVHHVRAVEVRQLVERVDLSAVHPHRTSQPQQPHWQSMRSQATRRMRCQCLGNAQSSRKCNGCCRIS